MGKITSVHIKRAICFCCGVCMMVYSGNAYDFSLYPNGIKEKFHFTQSEVEVISGVASFGALLGIIPGLLMAKFGCRITVIIGGLLSLTGYLLLWSAAKAPSFYYGKAWLIGIYFFIAYLSTQFGYMICLATNGPNFPARYRGTVFGCLDATYSTGTTVLIAVYGAWFVNGHIKDEVNQNFGGFFLMLAIFGSVTQFLGVFCVGFKGIACEEQKDESAESSDLDMEKDIDENSKILKRDNQSDSNLDITGCRLMGRADIYMVFLAIFCYVSVITSYASNVNVYLKSLGFEKHSTLFNLMFAIFSVIGKVIFCVLSDVLLCCAPRTLILIACNVPLLIMLVIAIYLANNMGVLLVTTLAAGLSCGATWTLGAIIVGDFYGLKYFGVNWGIIMPLSNFGVVIYQWAFGLFYEAEISNPESHSCFGISCFRWSYILATILVIFGIIFCIALILWRKAIR